MVTANLAADEELPPEATSARRARRLLHEALAAPGREGLLDAAQLAISEIVTNALVHAGTAMRLRILLAREGLRVELADGSPRMPHRREFGPASATGRGLHLLEELVTRWGAHVVPAGKVVWFEINHGVPFGDLAHRHAGPTAQQTVPVELHAMPLLMHQAWQDHCAALLRELMLVRLDTTTSALSDHAAASDALALLQEQVPVPEVGLQPETVMANATEPNVSAARVVVEVPLRSLSSFEALDTLLDEAVRLADEGKLLVPTTQPEMEQMRRWICEQVRSQGSGGEPSPWHSTWATRPPRRAPLPEGHWDAREVAASEDLLLAADDTNRIVAASAGALAMLGYEDPADLVGRRLLSIIPERYHQAHVAGFTLHLVNGRSPLLGEEITVPVRRRDGDEIEQRVLIRSHSLPGGRHVFVAAFRD